MHMTATGSAPSAQAESHSGNVFPWIVLIVLLIILGLVVSFHWDYTLMATPKGAPRIIKPEMRTTAVQTPVQAVAPAPVQVVPIPAPAPTLAPVPVPASAIVEEKPVCYVNIIVVDRNSGVVQFPVFEGVLKSSVHRNGKMTEFAWNGKPNTFYSRVLESASYSDDDVAQVGTISCPDINNPGKMVVVRCNQPQRDVYRDPGGMYYKTGTSGILPAPEQANWFTRPITPH
jgi:hypothetical protein